MKLPVVKTRVQIRYSDTDAMGHISNEAYVYFMSLGRQDFFEEIHRQTGILLISVVATLKLDYLNECFYGDDVEVVTHCPRVGSKSLDVHNEIYANGRLVAKGYVTNVRFSRETRKSEALPEDWEASEYRSQA